MLLLLASVCFFVSGIEVGWDEMKGTNENEMPISY